MKQFKPLCILVLLMILGSTQVSAREGTTTNVSNGATVYLPTSDGLCDIYIVEGTITFKASSTGTLANYRDNGVAFKPANEGEKIMITVNSIDISGGTHLIMYDGDVDYTKIGTSGAGGASPYNYFPTGWVKEIVQGSDEGYTFTSTTDNGVVAFGCTTRGVTNMTGWDITVTSMSPKDMEYAGATAIAGETSVSRGAKNQAIFGTDIEMDGGGNPLTLDELKIDASALTGSTQVTNVRLYKGTTYNADNLLATTTTAGDALVATNVTLKNGHNKFMVVADILPDASGTIPSLTLESVKVDGEQRTPTTTTADDTTIENTILIATENVSYTISENANFYDDGGKDGNITQGFEGQITFVPATEGNAIKIDFSKLDLFNTSSVGYNDVFKFYNGREVNEANLITTLLDEPEIVKSTADDGSITVYLKSTASYPKSGWEALVSQFLPGDMTLAGVTGEAASTATVSAGDTNAQMLVIDLQTDNTANPLSLKGINLTAADVKNIARARAYYLGKKNEFTTTNPFGEVEVSGTSIAITGEKELIEGHNYVAVVIDLNDNAQNGEQITLSLDNVLVGETTQAPEAAVSATRTVNNICRATQGSHSHVISGPWTFTNTEGYSGKYETVDTDYIVTFTPAEAGTVAQIDFSAFDVYYSSSSYGTKAVFEIYSGTQVNNANLLWSLQDASQSSTGPGTVLRSQSAEGSLTIRFNPKTTSSNYAGTGWTAIVQPFQNHNMEVSGVTVNQTSTDVLAPGASNAQLIDFVVETEGTLSTATINNVALDLKGSEAAVNKVSVFYNNTNDFATAIEFGNVENPAQSEVSVAGERELTEGKNYFWVTVDVKADADAEAQVDAKLLSITDAAGTVTTVENGDPEGVRVVKYIYLLEEGNNVIVVNNPLMFYDDGGPDGKVSKGLTGTVTFIPGRENSAIELNTQGTFSIGSGYMYVYNGQEANDDNLLNRFMTTTGPANLVSKAEDGSLTVYYKGNTTASTLDGWAIAVTLHEKTPYTIESVEATATNENVNRSMSDALMQQLKVTVSGDKEPITINSVKFTTAGTTSVSDIAAAKLYYTNHTANFGDANQVASLTTLADGENVLTLDTPIEISDNGDYYLWLTYDVAADAATGNKLDAQVIEVAQGDNAIAVTGTNAEREVVTGIKGTYVIGSSADADFPTFAAATAAMANGVEGAVRFEVEDGTYAENIVISKVRGTSEQNTVTFVSKSGDRSKVIITGGGYSDPGYGGLKKGMVFVETTPWISFESMSFVPQSQSYPYAIHIYNQSRHFTLKDSYLKAELVTSGYSGMNLFKTENVGTMEDKGGMNNDYLTIDGNEFYGGYIAMGLTGPGPVAVPDALDYVITNNKISEARSKGIYITDVANALIENNIISQSTSTATNYSSIDIYRNTGSMIVRNNVITHTHTYYSQGIYMRQSCEGQSENNPILVYNNSIVITNAESGSVAGIQVTADSKNIAFYNNTVRVSGSNGYVYYTAGSGNRYTGIKMQNNLLQNFTTKGKLAYINSADDAKALIMTNNAVYAASGTLFENHAATIDELNALNNKQGNFTEQAEFMSDIDNHLLSAGNLNAGVPVDFITTDADGKQRSAETPTIGAYEFAEVIVEKPEIAEGYPTVTDITETTATIKSKWSVSGKLYYIVEQATSKDDSKAVTADDLLTTDGVDITADTEVNTNLTDLTPNTTYKVYLMVVSPLGEESDVVETEEFTTLRHIEPLTATLNKVAAIINTGETATITPVVAGGDEPYTYEWRNQMNEVVGTEATLNVAPEYSYGYRLTVTSADGQTVNAKTGVRVLGEAVTASMDDNYLDDESHWAYDATTAASVVDGFYSGSYYFNNGAWPSYNYWYGYSLSNETATSFTALTDQWHSAVGEGHNGSSNFAIAFPEGQVIEITNSVDGDYLKGAYVSNSAYAYNGMAVGDSFATAFSQGSWFKLTAVGLDADDEETARVDFYLADYRSTNALDHYILDTWQWMDLRPLGKVAKVRFLIDGSDKGQFGLNTAAYFALDDFNCERDLIADESRTYKVGNWNLDLKEFFNLDNDGSSVVYSLEDLGEATPVNGAPALLDIESDGIDLAVADDGMLNINAKANNSSRTMIIGATQKGKTQYMKLSINVDNATGIEGLIVENGKIVESRQYVNVAGQVSDSPFNGMNIIVTRYTDGTTNSAKTFIK